MTDLAEDVQRLQRLARAHHHRRERILGEEDRKPGLLAEQGVEVLEQRATAGEDDAPVGDVAGQLGRVRSRVIFTASTMPLIGSVERLADLVGGDGERARERRPPGRAP